MVCFVETVVYFEASEEIYLHRVAAEVPTKIPRKFEITQSLLRIMRKGTKLTLSNKLKESRLKIKVRTFDSVSVEVHDHHNKK